MSLSLYLLDSEGEVITWLGWLRNPFGLCNWAEANASNKEDKVNLWDVCNNWSYSDSDNIDRKLFKSVVDEYHTRLLRLPYTYFKFNDANLRQFIHPYIDYFPLAIDGRIRGSLFNDEEDRVLIPLSYFDKVPLDIKRNDSLTMHEHYFKWYSQLVEFAEQLQNESYRFYCTN